jgi:hypothetical protein
MSLTGSSIRSPRPDLAGVQRKVLTPNEFGTLEALEHYLPAFQARYQGSARPFCWTFTRADLHQLLARLAATADAVRPAA